MTCNNNTKEIKIKIVLTGRNLFSYDITGFARHRVFTFIVGIQFWHICFSGTFNFLPYSHTLLVFLTLTPLSFSLSLSLFNSVPLSLTHSLPHLSISLILYSSLSLSLSLLLLSLFHFSLCFLPPFSFFSI